MNISKFILTKTYGRFAFGIIVGIMVVILQFSGVSSAMAWTVQSSGSTAGLQAVNFVDGNNGWAVGESGTILHTTNGGLTWTSQNSGVTNTLTDVDFVDLNHGWVVAYNSKILHTSDGGNTWTTQYSWPITNAEFIDANNGWAAGRNGTILHTTNGGTTWAFQTSGVTNYLTGIDFVDINNGWVVGDPGIILHTTDGGTTWTIQTTGTSNPLEGGKFVDANNGWVSGDMGTILHTTNGGTTWTIQTSGTTNYLVDVDFLNASNGWAVGLGGTILRYSQSTATIGELATITVSPAVITLSTGQYQQFTATGKDARGNNVSIIPTWSSSNTTVGTINAAGIFTALAAGTTATTATSGGIRGTATVTVTEPISASESIIFQENFDSTPTGMLPSGWQVVYSGAGSQYQVVTDTYSASPSKSLQLLGSHNWGANVKRALTSNADMLGFEAYVRTEGDSGSIQFFNLTAATWGKGYGGVAFSNGYITASSNTAQTNLIPYQNNTWYKVRLLLDRGTDTYKIWINDTLVGENLITNNSREIDSLMFNSAWDSSGMSHKFYFDDVKVFTIPAQSITITTSTGSVIRSISPSTINPGSSLNIMLTPSPLILFGSPGYQVFETIPQGFTFVSSAAGYTSQGNIYNFTQIGSDPITYTLRAPSTSGNYTISGTFKDDLMNTGTVSGSADISVMGCNRYDLDCNGRIDKNEATQAVMGYFNRAITRQEAIEVVMAFFGG